MNGVPHAPIGDACAATRNRARSGLALARLPHPGRNVPRRMQDAPDIDFRLPFYVEDQIRKLSGRLDAKAGKIQLMSIAGRAPPRLFADMAAGVFQRVDEGQRDYRARLGHIVLDGLIDITPRPLA